MRLCACSTSLILCGSRRLVRSSHFKPDWWVDTNAHQPCCLAVLLSDVFFYHQILSYHVMWCTVFSDLLCVHGRSATFVTQIFLNGTRMWAAACQRFWLSQHQPQGGHRAWPTKEFRCRNSRNPPSAKKGSRRLAWTFGVWTAQEDMSCGQVWS